MKQREWEGKMVDDVHYDRLISKVWSEVYNIVLLYATNCGAFHSLFIGHQRE